MPGLSSATVYLDQLPPDNFGEDSEYGTMQITAMWLGVCDGFLIETSDKKMMIDGGIKAQAKFAAQVLEKWDIQRVNYYFNSHPHDDHLLAATSLIYHDTLKPDVFLSPFPKDFTEGSQQYAMFILNQKDIPYRQIADGEVLTMDSCKLTFLQNAGAYTLNDRSMMTRVDFGDCSMLLTADITFVSQNYFLETLPPEMLKADILKIPHHGYTGTEGAFVSAVDPKLAFVSRNDGGDTGITRHMRQIGLPLLHSINGTIVFVTDGHDWYVKQYAHLPARSSVGQMLPVAE